jgi:hypothetical protein
MSRDYSASSITQKARNRAVFFGNQTDQQLFNNGSIIHPRSTASYSQYSKTEPIVGGTYSVVDGKTQITPNEQALALAKTLNLTEQILFFTNLVNAGIPTSEDAELFNQTAFSSPQEASIEFRTRNKSPSAPVLIFASGNNQSITVVFTQGSDGGSPITNYEYSVNGGSSFTAFSPGQTTSPITISGLTNGTAYQIQLKAVNSVGKSDASNQLLATPSTVPSAPTGLSATAGDSQITISFTQSSNGGSAIINYEYSLNSGEFKLLNPADTTSSITITGLTNGTAYNIRLQAVNAKGSSLPSASVSGLPIVAGTLYTTPTSNTGVTKLTTGGPFASGFGNSYLFNGSSSYLSVSGNESWAFGTGDFTIEWFQYQTDNSQYPRIFSIGVYPAQSIGCSIEGGTFYTWFPNAQSFGLLENYKNVWIHFAIVRRSGILYVYKNGIQFGSGQANTTNITNSSTTLYIGVENGGNVDTFYGGRISNIRIVKGLAVYTGNFTVPTNNLNITQSANPYGGSNTQAIPFGYTKLLFTPT